MLIAGGIAHQDLQRYGASHVLQRHVLQVNDSALLPYICLQMMQAHGL